MFGVAELTKHPDIDQYKYSGYGIRFYRKGFSSLGYETGWNVIIVGVDMSPSPHIDNKKKNFNSRKRSYTRIRTYTLTAKKLYSVNFAKMIQNFV